MTASRKDAFPARGEGRWIDGYTALNLSGEAENIGRLCSGSYINGVKIPAKIFERNIDPDGGVQPNLDADPLQNVQVLLKHLSWKFLFREMPQASPKERSLLEYYHRKPFSCQIKGGGQTTQTTSHNAYAFLFPGKYGDFFREFRSVIETRLFNGNNGQRFPGFLPFADRPAGLVANPAYDSRERDSLLQDFGSFREISHGRLRHHGPNVHMDRTGCCTVGRLLLDAPVFQPGKFVFFHGSAELPSDECHAADAMVACTES